jgi:protein TonB
MSDTLEKISKAVIAANLAEIADLTQTALEENIDAQQILDQGLTPAIDHAGAQVRQGKMSFPEFLRCARTMQISMDLLKPLVTETAARRVGKPVTGPRQADLPDLCLLESSNRRGGNRSSLLVSLLVHAVVLLVLVIVPLLYYQALPSEALLTFLAPLPGTPPPPAPAPATRLQQQKVVTLDRTQFVEPTVVPKEIPPPLEEVPDLSTVTMSTGAVSGGISAAVVGRVPEDVPGGVIGAMATAPPPPPPPPKKRQPIRVVGNVQSAKLIRRVAPDYPELAKRTRVEGVVLLQVVVDEVGQVVETKILRGHPLLTQAAVEAVRQWRYSPTLLQGEPIPVTAVVTVNFVLRA